MRYKTHRVDLSVTAWLVVATLVIGGCGFQLRGQALSLSGVPSPIHVSGIRPYTGLQRELARQFEAVGVRIAERAADGAAVLRIDRRSSDSRVLSVDSRNKAVEYELEESARFSLRSADGRQLAAEQTVRVVRIQLRPGDAILASDREADQLRADMQRELAERIVRRLAAN